MASLDPGEQSTLRHRVAGRSTPERAVARQRKHPAVSLTRGFGSRMMPARDGTQDRHRKSEQQVLPPQPRSESPEAWPWEQPEPVESIAERGCVPAPSEAMAESGLLRALRWERPPSLRLWTGGSG